MSMPSLKTTIKNLSILIVALTVLCYWSDKSGEVLNDEYSEGTGAVACNVSDIKLQGNITTYTLKSDEDVVSSENIVAAIQNAEKDDSIKAIILEIDSGGGYPIAGEEIANALKSAKKPTAAIIRQTGASAAYWSATGADRIFASSLSDVGSIGATMSYLDNTKKNETNGLTFNNLSSGKFKDTGNPDKPLSEEEKQLLERDVNIIHEKFISAVAANRNLDIKRVRTLADGSTMLGDAALANGLIDQIGGISEARGYLKGIIGEDATVCQ